MVDVQKAAGILNQLEAEYLRLGSTLCNHLHDETQLSAFLLLGLRSIALLKSMLPLIQPSTVMAGCDAVERAFLESSQLQFEFRFLDAATATKIGEWFARKWGTWKSDKDKLNSYMQAQKGAAFRKEYSDYSEAAHPTVDASRSSVALVTSSRGMHVNPRLLIDTVEVRSGNYANLVFREIWTALARDTRLIEIPIDRAKIPQCVAFVDEFIKVAEQQENAAKAAQP